MLQLKEGKVLFWFSLVVLGLLILPAFFSLLHPGFFLSDDGNWMVIRFSAFYESLRQGQFPPRFLPRLNHGYGYPVADFLYPLFLYIGVPIHGIGISFVNTVKIILGGSLILSGLCSFLWLRKLVSNWAALAGAFVYVAFPYHIFDVYQRGSVGEVLALAIVPFILLQIERRYFLLTSVSIALLILAHNSLAVLFLPVIMFYIFYRKAFSFREFCLIIANALFFTAFFWIPALYDKQFTIFDTTPVSDISGYFLSLLSPLIGWITLLLLVYTTPLVFKKKHSLARFFWILSVTSLFFVLPISLFAWRLLHITPYFQFPYRFLSVTLLGVSVLAAITVETISKKLKVLSIFLIVGIVYVSSWSLLFPTTFQYYPDTFYSTNQDSTTVKNEYTPIWVKNQPTVYTAEKLQIIKGDGVITDVIYKGSSVTANAIINRNAIMQLNITYFPGWEVKVDGKRVAISYTDSLGVMQFPLSVGGHTVEAYFTETPVRLFADGISLCSLLVLGFYFLRRRYEK